MQVVRTLLSYPPPGTVRKKAMLANVINGHLRKLRVNKALKHHRQQNFEN